ncbi:CUBN [Mytilus edulis]|uniref:CUBN n=1 Tax=Mytilus edulis TaxID=6550 RepID=A0A8S3UCK8_MYTED|nr:CUBN [Mytilus edulis]
MKGEKSNPNKDDERREKKNDYDGDQYIGNKNGSDGMAKDGYYIKRIVIVTLIIFSVFTLQAMCWKKQKCEYYIAKPYASSFTLPQVHGSYPKDFFHCWQIRADKPKNEVKICFESFMLEPHHHCDHDNLIIYDGEDDTGRQIGKYCGSTAPSDIISDDGVLYFEFYSDNYVEYEGFTFTFVSGEKDDLREACDKKDKEDEEDEEDDKNKKHSLTTKIVGGIIGALVLLTGSVVLICLCVSSRRCSCRPGSGTINPDANSEEGRRQIARRRRNVIRTDRVSHGESLPNPETETTDTDIPLSIMLPIYSGPTEPPPYNGHDVIERLPSSPPPPYSPNDPNPLIVRLCDINMPCVPDNTAVRY